MGWLLVAVGYLCGSVPFGVLVTRWRTGQDVRQHGSGNIGATNVARVAGKGLGALVLVLDALKGALPVLAAVQLFPELPRLHVAVAAGAFLGHVFPVWLRFKGGKGVATAAGVLAVLVPWASAAGFLVWVLVLAVFRVSSVGSLLGALAAVVVAAVRPGPVEYVALVGALLLAMLYTHRANLQRLVKGKEHQV